MILQSLVFKNDDNKAQKLFVRGSGFETMERNEIIISKEGFLDTFTYMNLFDAGHWSHLTGIKDYSLKFEYKGEAELILYKKFDGKESVVYEKLLKSDSITNEEIKFFHKSGKGIYYFVLMVKDYFYIKNGAYHCIEDYSSYNYTDIKIGMITCTYDGKSELHMNLKKIKESAFFKKEETISRKQMYGKLYLYVIDNKSELKEICTSHLSIIHNRNTGGSGGFFRGLSVLKGRINDTGITHVLFADDDVQIDIECLYRLYALLSKIKSEFSVRPVAGRMFDLRKPHIQYTAADIWNKGYVIHEGYKADMTDEKSLSNVNILNYEKKGDYVYGGWWFSCVPYKFASVNNPLPFFLHCDDVEYGIRIGETPVILNGIDVLHDIPEIKANPILAYYDARNTMIVNSLHGLSCEEEMLEQWKNRMAAFRERGDNKSIAYTILAMLHFLKGFDWFINVDTEFLHRRLQKENFIELELFLKMTSISYKFCWRVVYVYAKVYFGRAVRSYRSSLSGKHKKLINTSLGL